MELLPDEAEREALLDQLAKLILAAGPETFVAAPIVIPDDASFPDRWTPDEDGVRRLLRRVMAYAGLDALGIRLSVDRYSATTGIQVDAHGVLRETGYEGAAAWFAGIDRRGECDFGVDLRGLEDPQALVGTLAHEVAHAYRHHEDLVQRPSELEERLTDLTTVYLGFGVLTLNGSERHRSSARGWSSAHAGYLSPQALAYLLAAQVIARGEDAKRIARHLAANQAACFRAACEDLRRETRDALIARLGLPIPALWPSARTVPSLASEETHDERPPTPQAARRSPRWIGLALGVAVGLVLFWIFRANPRIAIPAALAGPLVAWALTPRRG